MKCCSFTVYKLSCINYIFQSIEDKLASVNAHLKLKINKKTPFELNKTQKFTYLIYYKEQEIYHSPQSQIQKEKLKTWENYSQCLFEKQANKEQIFIENNKTQRIFMKSNN